MGEELITFGDIKIEKCKFHHRINLFSQNIQILKKKYMYLVWFFRRKKIKYFIGFKDGDYRIKTLWIMFPKTSAYVKMCNGETEWINFFY